MASGTFQLSDARDDLATFYTPDEEIVTFNTQQELMDKIRYYLANEEERQRIALKGLERTLRDHTYPKRVNELLTIIFG
ncbi:hypothetical protein D3C71_1201070 [compost metagenome]